LTRAIFSIVPILPLLALAAVLCAPLEAQTVVFKNGRVVDVESGSADGSATRVVRDGWIVEPDRARAESATTLDARGKYLIPGLSEMQAHVRPSSDQGAVDNVLALFLAHGVTAIPGMLGQPGRLALRSTLAISAVEARADPTGPD